MSSSIFFEKTFTSSAKIRNMPQMEEEYSEKTHAFSLLHLSVSLGIPSCTLFADEIFLSFIFVLRLFVVSLLCNAENSKFYEMIN